MMLALQYLFIGLAAGFASGVFGIGGGLVIVPVLVFFLKYSQHMAQGTSLAVLLLPIGFLAVYRYHQAGNIQWSAVPWIALGAVVGGFLGAVLVEHLSDQVLKKVFGVLFFLVSCRLIFGK